MQMLSSLLATIAARLCDPTDSLALCLVAAALLVGECFLCAFVIVKVPCECRRKSVSFFFGAQRERKERLSEEGPSL